MTVEFGNRHDTGAFRGLPEAAGIDVKKFARLVNNGELWRLFAGNKTFRVGTKAVEDTPPVTNATLALKVLERKRRP